MAFPPVKKAVAAELLLLLVLCLLFGWRRLQAAAKDTVLSQKEPPLSLEFRPGAASATSNELFEEAPDEPDDFIKWVDFNVTCEALTDASRYDIETHGTATELNWIELLAILACKNGGDFSRYRTSDMKAIADAILSGEESIETLSEGLSSYDYYHDAYQAVLGGMLGEYQVQVKAVRETPTEPADNASPAPSSPAEPLWETRYGLKCFLPIAKNFPYSDYDDFGVSRSYGYARRHLGHDMMGQVGTPVIAVESGYVEALGWNQYGGWRIGIRSFDGMRYYYYAHLRQNRPYSEGLEIGSIVTAGDVIGYLGRTGYSAKENTNNIDAPHLHFGIQIIFDESQKEGNGEIWIDCYQIIRFLYQNRCETVRNDETKEWTRLLDMTDPAEEEYRRNRSAAPSLPTEEESRSSQSAPTSPPAAE